MKVAFCTQDMKHVDAHFGWAKNIVIHDVHEQGHQLVEAIQFEGEMYEDGNEDKLVPKLAAIEDCTIVYVAAIGASGAARVVAKKIHPIKVDQPEAIDALCDRLSETLRGTPPPWLRKALGKDQPRTFDFEEEEA